MSLANAARPVARAVGSLVSAEVERRKRALTRPWREGRSGTAAEVGRWIGVGLAVGAFVGGVIAAIRFERSRR